MTQATLSSVWRRFCDATDSGRPVRVAVVRFSGRNPLVLVGATVVLLWIVVSIAAPLISPYGPLALARRS